MDNTNRQSFAYHTHILSTVDLKHETHVGNVFTWDNGNVVIKISNELKRGQILTLKKVS